MCGGLRQIRTWPLTAAILIVLAACDHDGPPGSGPTTEGLAESTSGEIGDMLRHGGMLK